MLIEKSENRVITHLGDALIRKEEEDGRGVSRCLSQELLEQEGSAVDCTLLCAHGSLILHNQCGKTARLAVVLEP